MHRKVRGTIPYLVGVHQYRMFAYVIFTDEEQLYYTIIGLN
jgi:hypothetical protein